MVAVLAACESGTAREDSPFPAPLPTGTSATSEATGVDMSSGGMSANTGGSTSSPTAGTAGATTSGDPSGDETAGAEDDTSPGSDLPQPRTVLPGNARYMMAGDSITDRGHMWRSGVVMGLQAEGMAIETVGPYTDQAGHRHAGLDSQQTSFILQNMPTWLDEHDPNIVNLLIGVNDIRGGIPTDTIASNMTSIVQTIRDAEPDCFVFVNSVMRYQGSFGGDPTRVPEINAAYIEIVDAFAEQGMPIYWVDLYSQVAADEIGDGLHPSTDAAGAALMTDVVLGEMLPLVP